MEAPQAYDVIISSLALHYIQDLNAVMQHISAMLKPHGSFVFSIEHPIFTAEGSQTWRQDTQTQQDYWPMDHYFDESARQANFLGHTVTKYHHSFSTIIEAVSTMA
jgi:predicted TPR repeat methyltransferase